MYRVTRKAAAQRTKLANIRRSRDAARMAEPAPDYPVVLPDLRRRIIIEDFDFGHRYVVERVLNHGARKVGCTRCGKHWAMHDGTRSFVPWDREFEALYAPGGILAEASEDGTPNAALTGAEGVRVEGAVMQKWRE